MDTLTLLEVGTMTEQEVLDALFVASLVAAFESAEVSS